MIARSSDWLPGPVLADVPPVPAAPVASCHGSAIALAIATGGGDLSSSGFALFSDHARRGFDDREHAA
jgi:hypothetical protein